MALRKRAHQTEAARLVAGVNSEDYWDFQPGQRVRTVEGLLGIVVRVEDGPHPGSEAYVVELDGGMGGGNYTSSELEATTATTATTALPGMRSGPGAIGDRNEFRRKFGPGREFIPCVVCGAPAVVEAMGSNAAYCEAHADELGLEAEAVWVDTPESEALMQHAAETISAGNRAKVWVDDEEDVTLGAAEGSNHTADQDYPELGDILVDRPPLAHAVTGSLQAAKVPATNYNLLWDPSLAHVRALADAVDWDTIPTTTIGPDEPLYSSEEMLSDGPIDKVVSGREPFRQGYDPKVIIDRQGRKVVVDGNHRAAMYRALGQAMPAHVYDDRHTAGIMDRLLDPWARGVIDRMDPEYRPGAQGPGSMWSYDWCRFRKNRRCMYAKELNVAATEEAGYAVWIPVDRGLCPRDKWPQQEACPVGEPGPHSGHPNARIEATVPWEQGGQRGGIPERTAGIKQAAYFWPDGRQVTDQDVVDLAIEHGVATEDEAQFAMRNKFGPFKDWVEKELLYPMWARQELDMRTFLREPAEPPKFHQDVADYLTRNWPVAARKAPFEFFAAWKDIQEKAKRIRTNGGVRILSSDSRFVAGQVAGTDGVYDTRLEYAPGSTGGRAIAIWECTCPWAKYAWGRSAEWKKFEGRQCAHALALAWEVQSRGMFGREITEDTEVLAKIGRELPSRSLRKANPTLDDIVKWVMAMTKTYEPNITRDMKRVVTRSARPSTPGPAAYVVGNLEGLQYKFKSYDSLMRKFKDKLDTGGKSLDDPFAIIQDALRYTMVFSDIDYSSDVQNAMYALEEMGYTIVESANSWMKGDAYSGFHLKLIDPGDHLQIELQFHTSASYELKNKKMHVLYEEYRDRRTPLPRKREIWGLFVEMYEHLPIPEHALEYEEMTLYPPPGTSNPGAWRPKHGVSVHPGLAAAPAVQIAAAMLSEGEPFPLVAEAMTSMGASNGLVIVTEAMGKPIKVQVPGKGTTEVIDLDPDHDLVTIKGGETVPANRVIYPTFHPTRGLSLTGLRLAQADSTGVMVALRPPQAVCEALEFEGGEPVEEMHITLCYLGDTEEVDRDTLEAAVSTWARTAPSLAGRLAGFGQFLNGGEEPAVLVALWDIPGLDRWRIALKDTLQNSDIIRAENHGFTPHLTLAYGDEPFDEVPEVPEEAEGTIPFETVIVAFGGEWREYPLQGPAAIHQPVNAALAPFPGVEYDDEGGAMFGRAGEGAVVDMRRALQQMVARCPKCGGFVGFTGTCATCGYSGPKVGAVVDDALQMISDGYEAGLVDEDAVSWFAPTDAGQAIARDRIGPEIAKAQVTEVVAGDTHEAADAEVHDPEEPALPSTTSDDDYDEEDWEIPHGEVPAPGSPKLSWLMSGASQAPAAAAADSMDIAAGARAALAKMGLKTFTPAEQQTIIEEGADVTAGNLAALDIAGTHYEPLEAAFVEAEEDEDGLWL